MGLATMHSFSLPPPPIFVIQTEMKDTLHIVMLCQEVEHGHELVHVLRDDHKSGVDDHREPDAAQVALGVGVCVVEDPTYEHDRNVH